MSPQGASSLSLVADRRVSLFSGNENDSTVTDPVLRQRNRSLNVVFGSESVIELAMTFLTTIYCRPSELSSTFVKFRNSLLELTPRARVYGFAETDLCGANIHLDHAGAFHGCIQVVPLCIMRQVSHTRLCPWFHGSLRRIVDHPWFIPFLAIFLVLCTVTFEVLGRLSANHEVPISWGLAGVQLLLLVMYGLYLSRPILKLVLLTFDFYLVLFWIAVSTLVRVFHTDDDVAKAKFRFSDDATFVITQVFLLLLDACPPISRRSKGLLFSINAVYHMYSYGMWTYDGYVHGIDAFGTTKIVTAEFPTILLGQTSTATLIAFNFRLAFRCWFKHLDLAVIDFATNVVPHVRFEDDTIRSPTVMLRSATNSSHSINEDDANQVMLAGAPKFVEESASLANFGRWTSQVPESLRRATRNSSSRSHFRDSATRLADIAAGGRGGNTTITLHVDGSMPCASQAAADELATRLDQLLSPFNGTLDTYLVEASCAFSPDRRTFLPASYMISYSPVPVLPWAFAFRIVCKWWFPYLVMVTCGAGVFTMAFELNSNLTRSTLWAQCLVRIIPTVEIFMVMLFGVSRALARDALKTLDFWYVIIAFSAQNAATAYEYVHTDVPEVAFVHSVLVAFLGLFVAFMDCFISTSFRPFHKGLIGLLMAMYTIHDLFIAGPPDNVKASAAARVDLGFTVFSAGSMTKLSSLSLLILYLKIAVRTLLMGSSLIFFQIGAKEEILGEDGFVDVSHASWLDNIE